MPFAHSRNDAGDRHDLGQHLRAVADLAAGFAEPFGGSALVRYAGRLHDLGKANPDWQAYLHASEREPGRRHAKVDHKGAGACVARDGCWPGSLMIQGHHSGLSNLADLNAWLADKALQPRTWEGIEAGRAAGLLDGLPEPPDLSRFDGDRFGRELFLRLCFSALVDADRLDTEAHFTPDRAARRAAGDLGPLSDRLRTFQADRSGVHDDPVNAIRHEVYEACLRAAALESGFFRLTVPTGGGKTLSALAFALDHARAHGLRRVVYAAPYLTITDQTADAFRRALGDDRVVLEHYGGAGAQTSETPEGSEDTREVWRRLAAENWDAPVVVTTAVQLLDSLFAAGTTPCRKLHRLAGTVLILDEAQTLPPPLLEPILEALRGLVRIAGASVVFCTATQPSFAAAPGFADLADVREIAPDPPRLFRALKRVRYEWQTGEPWSWERVAEEMRTSAQVLAIVNTRKDALALLDTLGDGGAFHLSTLLCGAHRREVLARVRARLRAGDPVRLVSTQVVEAGVDLDFPLVLRARGPLDRIVQAAGRCNREGRLTAGRVVVFEPETGGMPPGPYATAADATRTMLAAGPIDPDDPGTFTRYFDHLFPLLSLDQKEIRPKQERLAYEEVSHAFSMIGDDGGSVLVRYKGLRDDPRAADHEERVARLTGPLTAGRAGRFAGSPREALRDAQPYLVSLRQRVLDDAIARGWATELAGGIWLWTRHYDATRGLTDIPDAELFMA